ncbi:MULTISPECIES: exosortase O [unclassified Leptolyngbya]|uniref:exosortase O n=1 Tax=unclassified Leptolyngbya TaxID=2650499 RepID=UPI00168993AE|nr:MULTISPECIES: exosortase O [unclassified Leptolyngbya]MBD1909432.1 exosortase O [Leptolyngbya sp. FACHB-8]MBD2155671.1 exosortase O [Leptolyngbya sp. FACHB-16]
MAVNAGSASADTVGGELRQRFPQGIAWSAAIVLSWFYLNRASVQWLWQAAQELSLLNGLMLAAGGLVLLVQMLRQPSQWQLSPTPTLRVAPVALIFGCGLGAIATQWVLNLEQVPVVLLMLGTYSWLGLHIAPAIWRRGLAVAVAIAILLPFSVQFTTGLGFPSRILTAHAVEFLLHHFQIAALSSEDIIVLDTGLARVDLPCSGLKSLWTGTLFLLAATGLEGRQIGLRWLLVCLANIGLLILANIVRVFTLVGILHVLGQPALAETLHLPLGVIGFVAVCAIAWGLLQWVPRNRGPVVPKPLTLQPSFQAKIAPAGIVLCLIALTLLPRPGAIASHPPDLAHVPLSAAIQTVSIPLNSYEQDFFAAHSNASVQKQHFQFQGLSGDLLMVGSSSWQGHHAPELCLISSGFEVSHMEPRQLTPEILGRWLMLNGDRQSAAYWFQSAHRTTDDYLTRIWADVSRQESSWVLVSIVFDHPENAQQDNVQSFLQTVHETIRENLNSPSADI